MAELRSVVFSFFDDKQESKLPTVEQLLEIVMRKEIRGPRKASMDTKMDLYWDVLFPKVAGNELWSQSKKYYQLLSTATCPSRMEGIDDMPCGHYTTEAMVMGLHENYFSKWSYEAIQKRKGDDIDADHDDMKTLGYVDAVCGRQKCGGWTKKGKKRIHELAMEIKKNRKDRKEEIRAIEQACLDRLRYV